MTGRTRPARLEPILLTRVEHGQIELIIGTIPGKMRDVMTRTPTHPDITRPPLLLTSFVGRTRELATLARYFADGVRLVTLLGSGGAGKTRLALEHVPRHPRAHDEGWHLFCDLSEARQAVDVLAVVAGALRVSLVGAPRDDDARDALGHALAARGAGLLVLDNAEPVAGAVGVLLVHWLTAAPALQVLVTSRMLLHVPGEVVLEVGPLSDDDAVALFRDRVGAPGSRWTDEDPASEHIRQLVHRLEGLPLAIEMAASRARVLPVGVLSQRLSERLDLLRQSGAGVPRRHSTLEETVAWSWELLEPWERDCLLQCGAFCGSFSLEAAEAVVDLSAHAGAPPVLDCLEALCEKSLLRPLPGPDHAPECRFGMYVHIRDFASQRLMASPAAEAVSERHARWYCRLDADEAPSSRPFRWQSRWQAVARDEENLKAVVRRAGGRHPALALHAALALSRLLLRRGPVQLLDALLESVPEADVGHRLRVRSLYVRAVGLRLEGRLEAAYQRTVEALELARASGAGDLEAWLAAEAGIVLIPMGRPAEAEPLFEAAVAKFQQLGLRGGVGYAQRGLGICRRFQGRLEEARALLATAADALREAGDLEAEANALGNLALLCVQSGWAREGERRYRRVLELAEALDDPRGEAFTRSALGETLINVGRLEEAQAVLTEALEACQRLGCRRNEAVIHGSLGSIYLEHGALAEAERCYQQAFAQCEQLDARHGVAAYRGFLGVVALYQARWSEGRARLRGAIDALAAIGDRYAAGLFAGQLCLLEASCQDQEAARAALAEAFDRFRGRDDRISPVYLEICEAFVALATGGAQEGEGLERAEAALARADGEGLWAVGPGGEPPPIGQLQAIRLTAARLRARVAERVADRTGRIASGERQSTLTVGLEGEWFQVEGQDVVHLETRGALRRLLVALARARDIDPQGILGPEALFAAGWPGQSIQPDAAAHRVYVAVSTLRKLGLRDPIQRVAEGYRLGSGYRVVWGESAALR